MAGRFSYSTPERGHSTPWFKVGDFDVTTTVLVAATCVLSMFVWAIDSSLLEPFVLIADDVRRGQLWRLVTWPVVNTPQSIWTILTIAIFWYFGRELEGMLGRNRFAWFLLILTGRPGHRRHGRRPQRRRARVPRTGGAAGVHRRVSVRTLLLRHSRLGHRRRHRRPAGPRVRGQPRQRRTHLPLRHHRNRCPRRPQLRARHRTALDPAPPPPRCTVGHLLIGPAPIVEGKVRGKKRSQPPGVVEGPWKAPPPPPSTPSPDTLAAQAELDALLDKISAGGLDSLSADEKKRLNELSKKLR